MGPLLVTAASLIACCHHRIILLDWPSSVTALECDMHVSFTPVHCTGDKCDVTCYQFGPNTPTLPKGYQFKTTFVKQLHNTMAWKR